MPRLPRSLIFHAARASLFLPALLRECRDLSSARNELRWLREHAAHLYASSRSREEHGCRYGVKRSRFAYPASRSKRTKGVILLSLIQRRSRGEPLQYLLGNQPFGDLEILCRKNVLIPRPDTEMYTEKLGALLLQRSAMSGQSCDTPLRILDLCTGTGCIALLLHHLLRRPSIVKEKTSDSSSRGLQILGVDISTKAVRLANANLRYNISGGILDTDARNEVNFRLGNVLALGRQGQDMSPEKSSQGIRNSISALRDDSAQNESGSWDVVVSNPPYISTSDYAAGGKTSRSVRNHEPKLALVPPKAALTDGDKSAMDINQADQFYLCILQIAKAVNSKVVVMEIGDSEQASRVSDMARHIMQDDTPKPCFEIWHDDGTVREEQFENDANRVEGEADVCQSNLRAVVVWRGDWGVRNREIIAG